jgi:hypothetical protein
VFAETFKKSCENETPEHLEEVNGTIDQLAKMQENDSKHNLPSLNFKVLKGKPVRGSTHECDAWHDGAAKRIFCRIDGEAIILDRLDNALH